MFRYDAHFEILTCPFVHFRRGVYLDNRPSLQLSITLTVQVQLFTGDFRAGVSDIWRIWHLFALFSLLLTRGQLRFACAHVDNGALLGDVRCRVLLEMVGLDGADGLGARPGSSVLILAVERHAWEILRFLFLQLYRIQLDSVLFKWSLTREAPGILQVQ